MIAAAVLAALGMALWWGNRQADAHDIGRHCALAVIAVDAGRNR